MCRLSRGWRLLICGWRWQRRGMVRSGYQGQCTSAGNTSFHRMRQTWSCWQLPCKLALNKRWYCCSDNEYDALSLCSFFDLPLHEVLHFLDQDRLHMQQGLFPSVERDYILSSGLRYETEVCKVLMHGGKFETEWFPNDRANLFSWHSRTGTGVSTFLWGWWI